jgi:predicted metal-dependent enzyme (double-stranded beta helix superfamily)
VSRQKLMYRPVGAVLGIAAGALAGVLFKQVWKVASGQDDAPDAMDESRGWGEILAAAAIQGAIFAVVRAAVDRSGAVGVRRVTGRWPG